MKENKRVLIITYYWPPSAGSGVQRWLKFVKYLPGEGWDPVIFTPENPDFALKDASLEKEVAKDLEVLRFPIWEPYSIFRKIKKGELNDTGIILEKKQQNWLDKLAIWLRANVILPDPKVFWVKPSVRYLLDILETNNFKAVITTGPPHSIHLIGRNLKRQSNLTWIADFRDPWSTWEFLDILPMQKWARNVHLRLEKSVMNEADAIITISPTFQKDLSVIAGKQVNLITNGFDASDLPRDFFAERTKMPFFHIVYSGIIDAIRNPLPFLEAYKSAFSANKAPVKLTFVGKVSEQVKNFIEKDAWLKSHIRFAGYVSHSEVFGFYQSADLLLLILTNTKNAKGNIPGKLFEYMATGRQILALGDPDGDSSEIIKAANAGLVLNHREVPAMIAHLEYQFGNFQNSIPVKVNMQKFERKVLTRQLAKLIDEKVDPFS